MSKDLQSYIFWSWTADDTAKFNDFYKHNTQYDIDSDELASLCENYDVRITHRLKGYPVLCLNTKGEGFRLK